MLIPLSKFKAIIKYFCANTNEKFLGKTKLMKLFYFLDFTHVKNYGESVTGDTYYHLEYGPIPTVIKNLIDTNDDNPENSILSDTISVSQKEDMKMHKINCLVEFKETDLDYFSQNELETLKNVCNRFKDSSTKEIVELSHNEAPWLKTKNLDEIPYELAALDGDCKVTQEDINLLKSII